MSHFQGYMGGNIGQGYENEQRIEGLTSSETGFQSSPPLQNSTNPPYAGGTPTFSGTMNLHAQPTQPGHQQAIAMYTSPHTYSQSPQMTHPGPGMSQMDLVQPHARQPQVQYPPQAQYFPQHPGVFSQQVATNEIAIADVQQHHTQPSHEATAFPQSNARPDQPRLLEQAVSSQHHQQISTDSYAARSAQAYASIGPSSPTKILPNVSGLPSATNQSVSTRTSKHDDSPAQQAHQNRILTDCTRKVQEHAYYMKQAMDRDELSTVLDRAANMVGELGDSSSGSLTPKNYYELHMRALDDMPNLEEYFLSLTGGENASYSMKGLYGYVQYCPRVLPRLYLQISAGSALIRSKEDSAKNVLEDLIEAVKCVQNPLRGLFVRHFLLQVTRDKLPDGDEVQDAYEFVLANFIEMNRLWVRIQHLPGDGKSKEQRKRRERERNELRILVGTNLVRVSQLEAVTSKIYGEIILPKILEQITACGDPLAQAYLIDCIIQVFPDEYHIETLPILLAVCPKLRDKVNIRTIMQSLMDRLANYYAEEELLDEADINDVKKSIFRDAFPLFEECVQKVFQARGPKLVTREVVRLQTALVNFSLKCYPGDMDQVSRCLRVCIEYIRQACSASAIANHEHVLEDSAVKLDQASVTELEKMLSIPLDSLALKVLKLTHYADLLRFLPWENRRDVGMTMLRAIDASSVAPRTVKELEELFSIILPVLRGQESAETTAAREYERSNEIQEENTLVSKLVHLLDHEDPSVVYHMLSVARSYLIEAGASRVVVTLVPVVFAALRLANRLATCSGLAEVPENLSDQEPDKVRALDHGYRQNSAIAESGAQLESLPDSRMDELSSTLTGTDLKPELSTPNHGENVDVTVSSEGGNSISCRKVFLFIQTTIAMLSKGYPEQGLKLFLQAAVSADGIGTSEFGAQSNDSSKHIVSELFTQAFQLHEEILNDSSTQQRCIVSMIGALLACQSLSRNDYENFITKAAQYAAKLMKKQDQCRMVAVCSHLFYAVGHGGSPGYQNPQRTLECLQRSLKLADASASSDPADIDLFVDLLEHYIYYYQENNPIITEAYITGLVALIKEHLDNLKVVEGTEAVSVLGTRSHFERVIEYIRAKKKDDETAARFSVIDLRTV